MQFHRSMHTSWKNLLLQSALKLEATGPPKKEYLIMNLLGVATSSGKSQGFKATVLLLFCPQSTNF
jgi:hypothetical protein